MGKSCEKIRKIVRIRHMLKKWRRKSRVAAGPCDVPSGYVAVRVGLGSSCRRFVVRATHLNHPAFKRLLVRAEEEYGFDNQGPLTIPCHESDFEEILRVMESDRFISLEDFQRCCHVAVKADGESRPLLHGTADKSVF